VAAAPGARGSDGDAPGEFRLLSVGAVRSSTVIDADTIYFGSMDGNLYAIG
jgi:hypothetical protein